MPIHATLPTLASTLRAPARSSTNSATTPRVTASAGAAATARRSARTSRVSARWLVALRNRRTCYAVSIVKAGVRRVGRSAGPDAPAAQALYWVDIPARRLHRWQSASGAHACWHATEAIGCIAPSARGGWIAGMESGVFHLNLHDSGALECERLATFAHPEPGVRANDGRCNRQGRLWLGTMASDMARGAHAGAMYRYCNAPALLRMRGGLVVPNGLAFSPDGRTMYLSDSHPAVQMIWQFGYDPDSGTPFARRLFADMKPLSGRPDGAAIDEDGGYWICGNDAGLVHRFAPGGRLDRSLRVPVSKPAMCAFGGAGLDTLFVMSIRPSGVDLADQPLAGGVFALRPGVRGIEEARFGDR